MRYVVMRCPAGAMGLGPAYSRIACTDMQVYTYKVWICNVNSSRMVLSLSGEHRFCDTGGVWYVMRSVAGTPGGCHMSLQIIIM